MCGREEEEKKKKKTEAVQMRPKKQFRIFLYERYVDEIVA